MLYSQATVNKVFSHIPASTMKYWWARGLFDCAATKEGRSRTQKSYAKINLYQIGLVSLLMAWGIPMDVVRDIVMALDEGKMKGGLIVSRNYEPTNGSRVDYKWLFYDPREELDFTELYTSQLFIYLNFIKNSVDVQLPGDETPTEE